jgi:dimethylsulfoniopropionate demethylase
MKSNNMSKIQIAKAKRLRSTPFTSRIEKQGLTAYTTYNHMLLPAGFEDSLEDSYYHLKEHVQVWDVAAERQVEISGEDSSQLVQLITCRDLSKSKDGRCYYCPIIDDQAGLINDPVVLRINKKKWWLSIADSDVILFVKGIAIGKNLNVKIIEPNVDIMAVQGPKSFPLMEKIFGKAITDLKFFGFDYFDFKGTKHLIARSGWSKQGGYEIYVEHTESGLELYDHLFEIGKEFNVKPGCPNLIERIESALLSYGNDFDLNDNPLECGFDKYVNLDSNVIFLGKEKLKQIRSEGINKKLMGVMINLDKINMSQSIELKDNENNIIGDMRSAVFSPTFKKVIGIAMFKKPYWDVGLEFNINIEGVSTKGTICDIPFI